MTKLTKELRAKLRKLRGGGARFDKSAACFTSERASDGSWRKLHGLTKTLASLVPVPRVFAGAGASRRTLNGPAARYAPADAASECANFSGRTMARCGTCRAAVRAAREQRPELAREGAAKVHGIVVDEQLTAYIGGGRRALFAHGVVDPCVGTLLEFFDRRGWALVASQVPLMSASMNVATACDLLATDRATRRALHLIEIKTAFAQDDTLHNYEERRGYLTRSDLRGMPLSFYARHQTQLCCMRHAALESSGVEFDSALLVRVSPGVVRAYELHDWWRRRSARIANAVAALRNPSSAAFRARQRRRKARPRA